MKEDLPTDHKKMITQANKSVDKVVLLVDDLLNANKTYNEQLDLKKTRFNLYKVVEECGDRLDIVGIHKVIVSGPQNLEINADAERIERVIVNFLNNAIKYAPKSKEIKILIERKASMARVSVIDQGPGIAPDKLPLLFDRYYRVNGAERRYAGLGLGLFISSEIIKKHGGEIGVDSKQGHGSTFWFTVPL